MIKKIYDKDKLLGIVIKDVNPTDKVTFYTDEDAPQHIRDKAKEFLDGKRGN